MRGARAEHDALAVFLPPRAPQWGAPQKIGAFPDWELVQAPEHHEVQLSPSALYALVRSSCASASRPTAPRRRARRRARWCRSRASCARSSATRAARPAAGSAALSSCDIFHPLHTGFTQIIGASISETTMRPNPRLAGRSVGWLAGTFSTPDRSSNRPSAETSR